MEFADFFFHEHPFELMEKIEGGIKCVACVELLSSPAYYCNKCDFYIHESCAEPPQIQNPYHPHPLTLSRDEPYFHCDACTQYKKDIFCFHCEECDLNLDIECAVWKLITDEDQLHHFSHLHPLVATEKDKLQENDGYRYICCSICTEAISNELYRCDHCKYYLHRSCAELQLPPTLQHFYHPCLLTLLSIRQSSRCQACGVHENFYFYFCKPCNFLIDNNCALMPAAIMESQGQQQFHHVSHGHPLKLIEIEDGDEILCSVCEKCCSGQIYVCHYNECKFSLHDSCFNLPQKICHPSHPLHPLTLYSKIHRRYYVSNCRICYRYCPGFTYSCEDCGFDLHVECQRITSFIKYQGHHHNIFFIDGLDPSQPDADDDASSPSAEDDDASNPSAADDDAYSSSETNSIVLPLCSACGTTNNLMQPMFHCANCDFHLHLQCGPLPCSIKHESHPYCHLKLTDSPVIVEGEDKDTDEFYCDTCEKKRDPHLPVYYCSDGCAYLAEIKCVISEVLLSLKGEYGEIELRSGVFNHQAGKLICGAIEFAWQDSIVESETAFGKLEVNPRLTMDVFLDALPDEGMMEIRLAFKRFYNSDNLLATYEGAFSCSDEDYAMFMASMSYHEMSDQDKALDSNHDEDPDLEDGSWLHKPLVNVGNGHSIFFELVPIFEQLCSKHGGAIFLESKLQNSGARSFFIIIFCRTVREMYIARVADVLKKELFRWWRNMRMLQHLGFKVEFALDRLKRVTHAYYALQVAETANTEKVQIDREIEEASRQIKELEEKVTALKERRKSRDQPPKPASSSIVAECFKEASVLKWMRVGDGLL